MSRPNWRGAKAIQASRKKRGARAEPCGRYEVFAAVFSVESDKAWLDRLSTFIHGPDYPSNPTLHWVDIGKTKKWGYPLDASKWRNFHRYPLGIWDRKDFIQPDVILIDGRFRAACLAAVKMRSTKPVTVLFDDYTDRDYYHGVEKLASKDEVVGRMARFTVTPGPIPPDLLTEVVGWFANPR